MKVIFDRELQFLINFILNPPPKDFVFNRKKILEDCGIEYRDGWAYQTKIFDELVKFGVLEVVNVSSWKGNKNKFEIKYRLKDLNRAIEFLRMKVNDITLLRDLLKAGRYKSVILGWLSDLD
jgi:hypothetical protein